jgi:hypothetical protein
VTLPTFLTVGAEKCGTTALHVHLSRHPQVFMSEPKEPSFFLAEDPRYVGQDMGDLKHEYIRTLAEYEAIFDSVTDENAIGESSPCYLYSDIVPDKIKGLIPDAKIIAILRNPVQRAYSQFVFNQQRGWESRKMTFARALELEDERFENGSMWAFHYTRRGKYSGQIKRYLDVFSTARVRVVLYDDFVKTPEVVLENLYEFLGVTSAALDNTRERHNVTGLPKSTLLHRLTNTSNPFKTILKRLLPKGARQRVRRALSSWNSTKPPADPDDLSRLENLFEADIRELAGIIDPDPLVWLNKTGPSPAS